MNEDSFTIILNLIRPDIQKQNTQMKQSIPPEEKLAVTLRFLATGESYKEIDYISKLSASFLSKAIMEICDVIIEKLQGNYLKFPGDDKEHWGTIAKEFETKWQFPLCIGALDGKYI